MTNPEETLKNLFSKLELWMIKPLRADVRKHTTRNHFIPFVVFSILIDNMASIRYLGEFPDTPGNSNVGKRYRKFIKEYMPAKYKKQRHPLYEGFRCKLVHKFQLDSFDIGQSPASRKHHLEKVNNGNTFLHSQEFLKELIIGFLYLKKYLVGPKSKAVIVNSLAASDYRTWTHG